ncbi:CAAX amino protease [Bacteroidia bacterium]|nr:CAAX amino protease [Bacteroidia bacterium]
MTKIIYTKPFLILQEQLAQLKGRGLSFGDDVKALHLLKYISYYRLSGYWYPLLENKQPQVFKSGVTFETVFNLYKFDRELRKIIIGELEKIEIAVRTQMAYSLSIAHGSFWLENESLFVNSAKYRATWDKIRSEMQRSDEEFISAFATKYTNALPPSFITLEIVSFGTLSKLYENLKSDVVKREISQTFGLPDRVFISWLHGLVYTRNVCAHHARLWNRPLGIQPLFPRHTQNSWISTDGLDNKRMYYVLSIVLYFLNTINPKHTFKQKLENLFDKYPNVDQRAMGFPDDWKTEPLWK